MAYNNSHSVMLGQISSYLDRCCQNAYHQGRAEAIDEIETKLVDIILGNEEITDWQKQEISLCLECVIEQLKEQNIK